MSLEFLLLYIILIILPFGQLAKLDINIPSVSIYLQDLVILLLVIIFLIKNVFLKRKLYFPPLFLAILGFFLAAFFSLAVNAHRFLFKEIIISFLYLLRWIAYSAIYFIILNLDNGEKNNQKIINYLIVMGVTAAVFGLAQYIFLPDIRPLTIYGWDPHYYRVVGTYLDPGFTGMIYVLSLILIVVKIFKKNYMDNAKKIFYLICFGIIYTAMSLTYARSAYSSYLGAMITFAFYKRSLRFILGIIIFGLITILALPRPGGEGVKLERQSTIWARIENYQQALKISWDNPVFGVGFNTYRYSQKQYGYLGNDDWLESHTGAGADCSLLFILATTGMVGLLSFITLLIKIITRALRQKNIIITASMIAIISHSFFNNTLFYGWAMIWLWLILAITKGARERN